MNALDTRSATPESGREGGVSRVQAWRARAVGSAASDIDIVFDQADRAGTVTALLAACVTDAHGQPVDAEEAWSWTLNQRLQALIAIRLASGDTMIELQAPCTHCGEAMAVDLDLHAFAADPVAPRFTWRSADGLELTLRLPNGRDLQSWAHHAAQTQLQTAAHEALAASLIEAVAGQPLSADQDTLAALLQTLDEAFEAHDPLATLHLQTSCPACAHDNAIACDLEPLLIDGFARAQASMLDDVLQLASALHWSEADILALPRWRRAHYLRQLTRQLEAGAWA
jgi:hypothetical protein